jgi:hypothetical protein
MQVKIRVHSSSVVVFALYITGSATLQLRVRQRFQVGSIKIAAKVDQLTDPRDFVRCRKVSQSNVVRKIIGEHRVRRKTARNDVECFATGSRSISQL